MWVSINSFFFKNKNRNGIRKTARVIFATFEWFKEMNWEKKSQKAWNITQEGLIWSDWLGNNLCWIVALVWFFPAFVTSSLWYNIYKMFCAIVNCVSVFPLREKKYKKMLFLSRKISSSDKRYIDVCLRIRTETAAKTVTIMGPSRFFFSSRPFCSSLLPTFSWYFICMPRFTVIVT